MLWMAAILPNCLGVMQPSGAHDRFLLLTDSCRFVHVGFRLWRGRVYSLQLLLDLANVVITGSKSHRIHDHILLSQIWDSSNLEDQFGHLQSSCCGTPSLKRGRVCNLLIQLAVTLRSKFRGTRDHILLSHLRLPQPGGPGLCIYITRNKVAQLYTRLPFCSLLRLAGLQWSYSNPPLHGQCLKYLK
jgi:hypothetical protein